MVLVSYLIGLFVLVAVLTCFFVLAKTKPNFNKILYLKVCAIILGVLFFIRYMSGSEVIQNTLSLENAVLGSKALTFFALISNWFMYGVILVLVLFPFFRREFAKNIVKFFCLPISILCFGGLYVAQVGVVGFEGLAAFNFRAILMAAEFGLAVALSFIVFWEYGKFKVDKKEGLKLLYIIPLMLLAVMPSYMVQSLFGYAAITVGIKGLNIYHRLIIYFGILIPIGLYFLLRKKDKEICRLVLLFISLGTLMSFSLGHKFESFLNITAWPFHLCNTAMYIVPLCLFFKWDKLFYFTLFINVLGAFLAMAMPNYSEALNLTSTSIVNFYINHYIAFFMPILIVALRVYKRPKLRQFIYSMAGFAVYFALILVLNAWFSNYASVDYFFVNSDFIAEKLGLWAENLRDIVWQFNIGGLTFVFYPLYQFLFFLVYVLLGGGMWFLYEWAYQGADTLYDIAARKKKIKIDKLALMSQLNGRSVEEPMNENGKDKIELINFSKRYGTSNVYAVKDANLTINAGEIFGFLGPNGAGKSTIIKSIVGIQPITEGRIEVCGFDVDKQSVMAKRQIGFVPDHYALYEKLTGREFINYIADLYNVSLEDRNKAIEKYTTMFQLADAFDSKIQTYSHGMKQKISIIAALIHNPKVWILDEPLIGLDPTSIFQIKECMKDHAKNGNIVFFSSHLIDVVERVCDRIAIIKKGHILNTKLVSEIEKDGTVEEFYLNTIKADVTATPVKQEKVKEEKTNKSKCGWEKFDDITGEKPQEIIKEKPAKEKEEKPKKENKKHKKQDGQEETKQQNIDDKNLNQQENLKTNKTEETKQTKSKAQESQKQSKKTK